ncbi:hypothetical protein QMK19_13170 [Streptomyces sp. H10-C2]|uniref:hypothetical protein n=1 Tax=unclassified Streptomyces TaxID=2593676 RepID=UPI0024BB490D|nr:MULTISPECIES: hypothetical protein [unclassified Streptomyces]MDJ0343258.1 hypothetical protein [Streptomyces sp. PH10-H1]MDJ0370609.1 hypothetical protein [Streptomyces sp. H10-C2]
MSQILRTQSLKTRRLTAAAGVAALEGLALAGCGVALLVLALAGHPASVGNALVGAFTVLALAAIPLAAAYGLLHARRWSRGPALIIQLLALPVAWTLFNGAGPLVAAGVALALVALAGLALLVHPATTAALGIGDRG